MIIARVAIRDARPNDWDAIWPFFRQIVAAGETYAYDREMDEARARRIWMVPAPGRTVVATGPDAFRSHPPRQNGIGSRAAANVAPLRRRGLHAGGGFVPHDPDLTPRPRFSPLWGENGGRDGFCGSPGTFSTPGTCCGVNHGGAGGLPPRYGEGCGWMAWGDDFVPRGGALSFAAVISPRICVISAPSALFRDRGEQKPHSPPLTALRVVRDPRPSG
jgi:hypothetical protein